MSPGPATANLNTYLKGAVVLPKIKKFSISKEGLMELPQDLSLNKQHLNNNNSRTSLFSKRVTSDRGEVMRNRFNENIKVYCPDLKTDNFGMHSPGKIYDTQTNYKKLTKCKIKRENANYSFGRAVRPIGVG